MRILKISVAVLCLLAVSGCACRARRAGAGEATIPAAEEGSILSDINFPFDSYALTSEAKTALQGHAQWLKDNAGTTVVVEGHCDERGTTEYNMALGSRRARSAADYLRSLGIAEDRISTISYGEEIPLDPRSTEEAWAKNRRDHFVVK